MHPWTAIRNHLGRPASLACAFVLPALAATTSAPVAAQNAAGPAEDVPGLADAEDEADESTSEPYEIRESLTVTDTRLADEPSEALRLPANVTVITRRSIERAGVDTLQDLLALEAGAIVYDQVGNDVGKTFDLRGFGGDGTRVYLDGMPLNLPRSNALTLELVPPSALERVEIVRGSTSALAGGGAEAGVVHLTTREIGEAGGHVSLGVGEYDRLDGRLDAWGSLGDTDVFLSGGWLETDGFRDNAGGELGRLAGSLSWDLGAGRKLRLTGLASESDFGTPGALTPDELAEDRQQAPFNEPDFADEAVGALSLGFRGRLAEDLSVAANLWVQNRDSEILSTGRSAPAFGGFLLDSDVATVGGTAQLDYRYGRRDSKLTFGVEWLDGDTDATGFSTPPTDPGSVDAAELSSDNTAGRTTLGLFAQGLWQLGTKWTLLGGARWDGDETRYVERFPDPTLRSDKTESELSLRAGLSYAPAPGWSAYVSYGEAFLPPTVEQLFSFPLFGSNPDLEPEDSRSIELGVRRSWDGKLILDAGLFQIDTDDEVVFDPDSPLGLFGANVNAGRSRRRGLETTLRGSVSSRVDLFAALTLIDAERRGGENAGETLPLVPGERLAAGVDVELPADLLLRFDGLWVGEQVLDNDDANAQEELDAYQVFNLKLTWRARPIAPGLALYLEARNLLDEEYATRGIYAFDFSTFQNEIFLTPAPGRRVSGGVEWDF